LDQDLSVPWRLRNRWMNCKTTLRSIECHCTHIQREGNVVADALASNGQSVMILANNVVGETQEENVGGDDSTDSPLTKMRGARQNSSSHIN